MVSILEQNFIKYFGKSYMRKLIYRILTLSGIAREKPQLAQQATGLGAAQIQQEKI